MRGGGQPRESSGVEEHSPISVVKRTGTRLEVPLLVLTAVLLIFFIREARAVLIPISVAVTAALLAWPLRAWLSRYMKGWMAGSVVSTLAMLLLAGLCYGAWWAVHRVVDQATEMQDEFAEMYQRSMEWLIGLGIPERWLPPPTLEPREWEGVVLTSGARQQVMNFLTAGLGGVGWAVIILLLGLGMFILLMLEIPRWDKRASEVFGEDVYCRTRETIRKTARQVRRYLLAKTVSGVAAGVLTAILCWAMGVPLAMMWGVLTVVLNYIPNVGSFIVGIPLSLLALLQLGTGEWMVFMLILLTIEGTTSNILDPLVQGGVMLLSPLEVTVSLVFWAWMWGAFGAFLAVPLTAGVVVALRHAYRLRPVGKLLSD
jgi:AI-2 transport protein TqsA